MKHFALFVISCCWIPLSSFGQIQGIGSYEMQAAICVEDTVLLLANPGQVDNVLDTIFWGEELSRIGKPVLQGQARRAFVQVKTNNSLRGWVDADGIVEGGFLAVVLAPIRLYRRPNTPSTATMQEFLFGEQVIVANQIGMWGELISKNRTKVGWVKELQFVSTNPVDFEIIALISEPNTRSERNEKDRWDELLRRAEDERAELFEVFHSYYVTKFPGESIPRKRVAGRSIAPQVQAEADPEIPMPQIERESKKFYDPASRKTLTQIKESGPIRVMQLPSFEGSLVEVAHETLPVGKKILIELPENRGFIEAIVTRKLDSGSRYLLGLSPRTSKLFFGEKTPKRIHVFYLKE